MRLIFAFFLSASALCGQAFFIHASDPQFGMYAGNRNFEQETANFEFFIANVNRLKPAFVVLSGDLINKPMDAAQTAEYHRIARKLNPAIKLFPIAGNHDVQNQPTPEALAYYRKNFGPDWYSFQASGIYGIVLNASIVSFPEGVQEEAAKQEAWLRAELPKAKASGLVIAILQHIPWYVEKPDEPDQYFNIRLSQRSKYLNLFREYGVRYLLAGHTHREIERRDADFHLMVTTGLAIPLGPEPSGFHMVDISATGLKSQYVSLGNIPNVWPMPAAPVK